MIVLAAVSLVNKTSTASLLAGNVGFGTSFEWISSITVGSLGASSVSFTEIPQGYRHLQVRMTARTGQAQAWGGIYVLFNVDTTSGNYRSHYLQGSGTAASSGTSAGASSGFADILVAGNSASANVFGSCVLDILDYSSTVKNKTARALAGVDNNGSGYVELTSGLWMSTAAITSMTITASTSPFQNYSTFSLYGIR